MTTKNLELTLSCPMREQSARDLGVAPGTCRLLVATAQTSMHEHRLLAEVLVRGFPASVPISIHAIGPFKSVRAVVQLLGPVKSDAEAVSIENAEQLAIVLAQWKAEELVVVPCNLASLRAGIAAAGSVFKLQPSGHMHQFAGLLQRCGPIANYSADHRSLECFGSEAQIMRLYDAATAITAES